MKLDRSTLVALVLAVAAGYWLASSPSSPVPSPRPTDRPIMRWIARAAKNALWLMLVAEPAPPEQSHLVHAPHVGEDGYPVVDHGRGW